MDTEPDRDWNGCLEGSEELEIQLPALNFLIVVLVFLILYGLYGVWGLVDVSRGTIAVVTEPVGATVVIDDWFRGHAPFTQRLLTGRHKISVRAEGYQRKLVEVHLDRPESAIIHVELNPEPLRW